MPMSSRALIVGVLLAAAQGAVVANTLQDTQVPLQKAHKDAAKTQSQIDQLDAKTRDDAAQYANLQRQADQIEAYNRAMSEQLEAQSRLKADLAQQLQTLADTEQSVLPLMGEMHDMLVKVVNSDVPFLVEERQSRLKSLSDTLGRADVSVAEKYRQILNAYQVEADYGRSIEAYQGQVGDEQNAREVTFLRLGRAALYYLSLDGQSSALWQPNTQQWQPLPAEHNLTIQTGIRMAEQQAIPQLLSLPLPAVSESNP